MTKQSIILSDKDGSEIMCAICSQNNTGGKLYSLRKFIEEEKQVTDSLIAEFEKQGRVQFAFIDGKVNEIDKVMD